MLADGGQVTGGSSEPGPRLNQQFATTTTAHALTPACNHCSLAGHRGYPCGQLTSARRYLHPHPLLSRHLWLHMRPGALPHAALPRALHAIQSRTFTRVPQFVATCVCRGNDIRVQQHDKLPLTCMLVTSRSNCITCARPAETCIAPMHQDMFTPICAVVDGDTRRPLCICEL